VTAEEFIERLRVAECRMYVHMGGVFVLTRNPKIVEDLERRGARRGQSYVRNPGGVRDLGEAPVTEWDITLRPEMVGVTGTGGEPVTLQDLIDAVRA
jgi:hypothetical protein